MEQRYLVIVSIGDSLTVGFQSPSDSNPNGQGYPYTRVLQSLMWNKVKEIGLNDINPIVENEGNVGESTSGMLRRFDICVPRHKPDYVIIWGGLNDLSSGVSAEIVAANLKGMYEKTRSISATPIGCTLSPVRGSDKFNEKIRTYNNRIQELCSSEGVKLIDLYSPLADADNWLKPEYNNDGAHLNTDGYTKVGNILFDEAVKHILEKMTKF
jgi:acyl-CoA thioesterase I